MNNLITYTTMTYIQPKIPQSKHQSLPSTERHESLQTTTARRSSTLPATPSQTPPHVQKTPLNQRNVTHQVAPTVNNNHEESSQVVSRHHQKNPDCLKNSSSHYGFKNSVVQENTCSTQQMNPNVIKYPLGRPLKSHASQQYNIGFDNVHQRPQYNIGFDNVHQRPQYNIGFDNVHQKPQYNIGFGDYVPQPGVVFWGYPQPLRPHVVFFKYLQPLRRKDDFIQTYDKNMGSILFNPRYKQSKTPESHPIPPAHIASSSRFAFGNVQKSRIAFPDTSSKIDVSQSSPRKNTLKPSILSTSIPKQPYTNTNTPHSSQHHSMLLGNLHNSDTSSVDIKTTKPHKVQRLPSTSSRPAVSRSNSQKQTDIPRCYPTKYLKKTLCLKPASYQIPSSQATLSVAASHPRIVLSQLSRPQETPKPALLYQPQETTPPYHIVESQIFINQAPHSITQTKKELSKKALKTDAEASNFAFQHPAAKPRNPLPPISEITTDDIDKILEKQLTEQQINTVTEAFKFLSDYPDDSHDAFIE